MTIQEIHKEVFEDIKNLRNKIVGFRNDFRKIVLRSSHYPLSKSYSYRTRAKKNMFYIDFTALKRSSWKKPILSVSCVYSRPEGKYAVALTLDMRLITIYPPHFFKRYRERIVKEEFIVTLH